MAKIGFCGTWDLHKRKRSIGNTTVVFVYEIRLWKTDFAIFKENSISFPLIYRFAGIRRVLTELEADH